ncbi:MAG TPA: hypothetical protein P5145_02150, partial [Tenuifilaceae bacterium]|nr:hypothetical protein [Tenuifilaceae bacterium]
GYDVGLYFISAMKNYGVNFNECLNSYRPNLLQSEFWFKESRPSALIQNHQQFIINYNSNFEVLRIK